MTEVRSIHPDIVLDVYMSMSICCLFVLFYLFIHLVLIHISVYSRVIFNVLP